MKSIAIIMPYFGKWPQWADLFFSSCQYNNDIDFLFYTDCEPPESASSDNIKFHQTTFHDYCQRVSDTLKIDFHTQRTYKLCDLKPFYGYIHQEELKGYDFWGFGDMDLVWGDIRSFYTDEVLSRYDVLSTHADRLSGHLGLFRNNKKYTELPFKQNRWQELLMTQENVLFDEHYMTLLLHPAARWLWKIRKAVFLRYARWFKNDWMAYNQFCTHSNRFLSLNHRRILFFERNTTPWAGGYQLEKKWRYSDGHVTDMTTGEDLIYLHFYALKKKWNGDYYHPTFNKTTIDFNGIH
jgi:hypothetical protein